MTVQNEGVDELRQASNLIYLQVAGIYLMFAVVIAWGASTPLVWPGFALVTLIAWALIGWGQFALFNALHEGLHGRFGSPHQHLGAYLLSAYPVGFGEGYKQVHLDHHRYFGDPQRDLDYVSYANFPRSRRQMLWRALMNLVGVYALLQFFGFRQQGGSQQSGAVASDRWKLVLVQVGLLALMSATIGWYYYIWLWLLPLVTFGKFYSFLRTFCEHASPDDISTVRTITGTGLGVKLLGAFNFHYHAEHHAYVYVPCAQLPRAHELASAELYDHEATVAPRYEHYEAGYFSLLWRWFKQLPA